LLMLAVVMLYLGWMGRELVADCVCATHQLCTSGNNFKDAGAVALARALEKNTTLQNLNFFCELLAFCYVLFCSTVLFCCVVLCCVVLCCVVLCCVVLCCVVLCCVVLCCLLGKGKGVGFGFLDVGCCWVVSGVDGACVWR
jgi:hypothetical protein